VKVELPGCGRDLVPSLRKRERIQTGTPVIRMGRSLKTSDSILYRRGDWRGLYSMNKEVSSEGDSAQLNWEVVNRKYVCARVTALTLTHSSLNVEKGKRRRSQLPHAEV
jgi:hypothetical protein